MKVYLQPKGITLVGKAWQIRYMLKHYSKQFHTVQEWIDSSTHEKRNLPL